MSRHAEIWLTVNCTKPIHDVLLNRGIAAGNEYRFDRVAWKVIVTRTADTFLEALRRAVENRLTDAVDDLECSWRMALGDDELLLVPPAAGSGEDMAVLREVMDFLRDLLYQRKFVGTTLRAVLTAVIERRLEEPIRRGEADLDALVDEVVEKLDAMDLDTEGLGAEQPAAGTVPPADVPAPAAPAEQAVENEPADEPDDEADDEDS